MALSEEDVKTFKAMFAEGVADGFALFRSREEEELAKNPPAEPPVETKGGKDDNGGGLDIAGFFLGR